jgi:hypothetical protein
LPEKFRPNGDEGHQFMECGTREAAKEAMAALRDAVLGRFPDAKVTEDDSEMHFLLADDREMKVELSPGSEYSASWQSHSEEETWTHRFGEQKEFEGFFWELEGGCVVDIGVTAARDEIVLLQSWVDEDEDGARGEGREITRPVRHERNRRLWHDHQDPTGALHGPYRRHRGGRVVLQMVPPHAGKGLSDAAR